MQDRRTSAIASFLSLVVVLSMVAVPVAAHVESGGTATTSDTGTAPDVYVPETTINVTTESTIQVAYNATDAVNNSSHLEIILRNEDAGYTIGLNDTLSTTEGVANLTVPSGAADGDFTAEARLVNNSTGTPSLLANNTSLFTVTGAESGGSLPDAPYVNASDRPIDPSVTSYVYVSYNATGQVSSPDNLSVAIRNETSGEIVGSNTTVSTFSGYANVSISAGVGTEPFSATIYLNNSTSGNTLTTDVANYTVYDGGSTGGSGATPISQSTNVSVTGVALNQTTVNESEDFALNVTLTNNGDVNETVSIPVGAYEWDNGTSGASVSWSTTKKVLAGQTVNATLVRNLSSYGGYDVFVSSYETNPRLTVLADGTNVVLRQVYDNQEVVVNEPQLFFTTAKNYGNVAGHGNLSMEWSNGSVITWTNTSVLEPGATTDADFSHTFTKKGEYDIYFNHSGGRELMNVTVRENVVTNSSFEIVSGPMPNKDLNVSAALNANQIAIRIQNATGGTELDGTGVAADTKFRINVTVQNFTSRVLIGSARNATWERTPINATHTRLTIVGTPAEVQYTAADHTFQNWPENDKADFSRNLTVDFSAFTLNSYAGDGGWAERINGTLISTDAQMFGTPEYNATANGGTGSLELTVAAPHFKVDGTTVNDGFYEAQLPQSLLDHWGVTDVSELGATYKGGDKSIDATALPGGGAKVAVPLTYSSGTVSIAPKSDTTGDSEGDGNDSISTGTDGSSEGTTAPTPDSDGPTNVDPAPTSETTDDTRTDISNITVSNSSVNSAGEQTVTASVTNAEANSTVSLSFAENASSAAAETTSSASTDATTALEHLNVSLSDNASFDVSVNTSTVAPVEATDAGTPDGSNPVSYVQVDHSGLTDEQINAASLTLRVQKQRFGDNFDPANAAVYRLHDGEWTEIDTTLISETATHYRFKAVSPGLSVFAVGEKSPNLTVESTSLSPDSAAIGEDVTVDAAVSNDGSGRGDYTAELAVDGEVVATKTVTVPAGETVSVALEWEFGAGGEYELALNGSTVGTVTVESVDRSTTTQSPTQTTTTSSPGLGVVAGLLGLLGAALLARRQH